MTPLPRLDGATSQGELFAQARAFLAATTAGRPLLLLLEDLLRFVARALAALPLLLIARSIPKFHPARLCVAELIAIRRSG